MNDALLKTTRVAMLTRYAKTKELTESEIKILLRTIFNLSRREVFSHFEAMKKSGAVRTVQE